MKDTNTNVLVKKSHKTKTTLPILHAFINRNTHICTAFQGERFPNSNKWKWGVNKGAGNDIYISYSYILLLHLGYIKKPYFELFHKLSCCPFLQWQPWFFFRKPTKTTYRNTEPRDSYFSLTKYPLETLKTSTFQKQFIVQKNKI